MTQAKPRPSGPSRAVLLGLVVLGAGGALLVRHKHHAASERGTAVPAAAEAALVMKSAPALDRAKVIPPLSRASSAGPADVRRLRFYRALGKPPKQCLGPGAASPLTTGVLARKDGTKVTAYTCLALGAP